MATFGLTAAGLLVKQLTDLVDELRADLRAKFGANIDLNDTSNWTGVIVTFADRLAEVWALLQAIHSATDPDNAEGKALVQLCAITGTLPDPATFSQTNIIATGTNGTVILTGRVVSIPGIGTQFTTTADGTLATATAWVASTVYAAGDIRANGGNIYRCDIGGTSAGSGGPTTTLSAITDGTVTWRFAGAGAAYAIIPARSVDTGPRIALAGALTNIVTAVSGWTASNNLDDAQLGALADNDATLRIRREEELLGQSASVIDAIRTRILEDVAGVTECVVIQNETDSTNGDGMPPHSVECIVLGGLAQDVVDKVYQNVAAGIKSTGNTSGTVVDLANGAQTYTISYSRPVPQTIYIIANVTVDALTFPADGATQIVNAMLALPFPTGRDVVSSRLKSACFKIPGVLDVPTLFIGTSALPATEATVVCTLRQRASLDSARMTINVTPGTP